VFGNVGIGTTNPTNLLTLGGTASGGAIDITQNDGTLIGKFSVGLSTDEAGLGNLLIKQYLASERIYNSGGVYLSDGATTWTGNSDRRLKKNIMALDSATGLSAIEKLNPVSFNWKDKSADSAQGKQLGFIAQEVQKVFPSLVSTGDSVTVKLENGASTKVDNVMGISTTGMIPPLVRAVQELNNIVKELKAENDALKARLDKAGL